MARQKRKFCECGNPIFAKHQGALKCKRCMELEVRMAKDRSFHSQTHHYWYHNIRSGKAEKT